MDTDTYNKIKAELTLYLNREPTENEIINGQTDINIMAKVNQAKNQELIQSLLITNKQV